MSIEVRPFGVRCNIQCQYCYQHPQRDAGNLNQSYDLNLMKQALEREGAAFTVFGGEPLMMPIADLEDLFRFGLERYGRNGVQTNGTLITADHIALFKQYKVHVGISIDGPGELNDLRWHSTLEDTRSMTRRTEDAIAQLCREHLAPSLIVTLHRINATAGKLPRMYDWVRSLDGLGIRSLRLHLLESESAAIREKYGLSAGENIAAMKGFLELEGSLAGLKFDVFHDMRRMLVGHDSSTTCIWNACDPYTTHAVHGVEGTGQRTNCGRTNKDGIDFVKADQPGYERYLALYWTPQEAGGCRNCRFFLMCKGQCPGTAIGGDWRNRTEHCEVWKALLTSLEHDLVTKGITPVSLSPVRNKLERAHLEAWEAGRPTSMSRILKTSTKPPLVNGTAPKRTVVKAVPKQPRERTPMEQSALIVSELNAIATYVSEAL